jgi:hypothetical protein
MSERYDLFRLKGDSAIWFATAETMQDANIQTSEITDCLECLVLDSQTGETTVLKTGHNNLLTPEEISQP